MDEQTREWLAHRAQTDGGAVGMLFRRWFGPIGASVADQLLRDYLASPGSFTDELTDYPELVKDFLTGIAVASAAADPGDIVALVPVVG